MQFDEQIQYEFSIIIAIYAWYHLVKEPCTFLLNQDQRLFLNHDSSKRGSWLSSDLGAVISFILYNYFVELITYFKRSYKVY